jgi:hypothetical protein
MDGLNLQGEVIRQHKETIKEVEEYLHDLDSGEQFSYTNEQLEKLAESGAIPKQLWDYHCRSMKNAYEKSEGFRQFKEVNKHLPEEELLKQFFPSGQLSTEETIKFYEDAALESQFLKFLLPNRDLLSKEQDASKGMSQGLFDGIDVVEEFGIANCISNSLYHLSELLKTMKASELYSGLYEAKSSVKNSQGEAISLTYTFPAQSLDDAKSILKNYQATMVTKGLKVLMAHWMMANKIGRVEYSCPMTEVMKLITDEERETFFSVKEKEEHWALIKMLSASKLSRERKVKKRGRRGRKEEIIQWIEQPLLEILGGEKEMTFEDKYPITIVMRVLMPRMDTKGFAPIIYKNNTTQLSPSDSFLAFFIQTRAGQRQRGTKPIAVDWNFIFEAGNLQATAISNHRMAKAQARKKMDRLQQGEIIEKWEEELTGVSVTPRKTKKLKASESK